MTSGKMRGFRPHAQFLQPRTDIGTTMSQSEPESKPVTLETWAQAAAKSAPGGNLNALNWLTPDGIVVKPLYTSADLKGLRYADPLPGFAPDLRGPQAPMCAARPWPIGQ